MPRTLLMLVLLSAACGRREVATGNWTVAARTDAAATTGKGSDEGVGESAPGSGAPDAASRGAPDVIAPRARP
jgi:hypothetical protein